MCAALANEARYDTPDSKGETRRQRNAKFGQHSPTVKPPEHGQYLWEWYSEVAKTRRKDQGVPQKLTPYELRGWAEVTGKLVRPEEYQALLEMDTAFIIALNAEYKAQWDRENPQNRSK